ncbi:MAG: radical SAM protein [Desulfobaccales bacterium]
MDKNLLPMIEDDLLEIKVAASVRSGSLHHLPLSEKAVLEQPLPLETVIQPGRGETGMAGRNYAQDKVVIARPRKSGFIRRFDGTAGLVCNKFYRFILSNGCPFNCQYCYLRLILGSNKGPLVFTNPWPEVERQLEKIPTGVFSTGELADSLAVTPPLLRPALEYFRRQTHKFLFLTTKSTNIKLLMGIRPTPQVWISVSVNAVKTWELFEQKTPHPDERLAAAWRLKEAGWRVKIRIDPVIPEVGIRHYREVAKKVSALAPERVTVGVLKHFPRFPHCQREGPHRQLAESPNGIKRYPLHIKARIFNSLAEWLGFQPAICRETPGLWEGLGWKSNGCNCTPNQIIHGPCSEAPIK